VLTLLARLEETALSTWLRESGLAFFSSLALHSLAMAIVVGINVALALRLLGVTPQFSLAAFRPYYRLHWAGVLLIFVSGLALLLAYPAKALSNPVFYLKLAALSLALLIFRHVQQLALRNESLIMNASRRGVALLALWVVVLFAGRFLAYTHSVLLASRFY
jgi:hypothetical protein